MTRAIKRMDIIMASGAAAVLSTVELEPGRYETMLASPDFGTEYAHLRTTSEAQAMSDFNHLRRTYHCPPLTGKYAKLRDDLRIALAAGRAVEQADPEDGGTCNFDSTAIRLQRWNRAKVEQAAREAGTRAFQWSHYGCTDWVFGPDTHGQGNARTRNAEAVTRAMRELGYYAHDYCQMD